MGAGLEREGGAARGAKGVTSSLRGVQKKSRPNIAP